MSAPRELAKGAVVIHQRRDPATEAVVVATYTVRGTQGSKVLLARRGQRALTRVELATVLGSPAWAVQESLW